MGKTQSKHTSQEGDTNINIVENLENNQVQHENHEIKLWLILAINVVQIIFLVFKTLKRRWRREGFERARAASQDILDSIQINK